MASLKRPFSVPRKVRSTPTRAQLSEVMGALQSEYPFLADATGQCDSLRNSLINKMKKQRRLLDDHEQVLVNREKYGKGGGRKRANSDEASAIERKKENRVIHPQVGEDSTSISMHIECMVKECQKSAPNMELLLDTMRRTAVARRIALHEKSASEVLVMYPALSKADVLKQELELITGVEMLAHSQVQFAEAASRIIGAASKVQNASCFFSQLHAFEDTCPPSEKLKEATACCSILCLPSLFKEDNAPLFVTDNDPEHPQPTIVIKTRNVNIFDSPSFGVHAEGVRIVDGLQNIQDAVACLMTAYHLLNIVFAKRGRNTLTFIQESFLVIVQRPSNHVRANKEL